MCFCIVMMYEDRCTLCVCVCGCVYMDFMCVRFMFNACVGVFIAVFSYSHKQASFVTIKINHMQAERTADLPSLFYC